MRQERRESEKARRLFPRNETREAREREGEALILSSDQRDTIQTLVQSMSIAGSDP